MEQYRRRDRTFPTILISREVSVTDLTYRLYRRSNGSVGLVVCPVSVGFHDGQASTSSWDATLLEEIFFITSGPRGLISSKIRQSGDAESSDKGIAASQLIPPSSVGHQPDTHVGFNACSSQAMAVTWSSILV